MSIKTEIEKANGYANIVGQINTKIQDIATELDVNIEADDTPLSLLDKIETEATSEEYKPDADMVWARKILEADTNSQNPALGAYKLICLLRGESSTTTFMVPLSGAVKTSDGAYYSTHSTITHTWDDTNVKTSAVYPNMKLRWIIFYYPSQYANVNGDRHQATCASGAVYCCLDNLNVNAIAFGSDYLMEYFEYINGASFSPTNCQMLFSASYSLKALPYIDTSSAISFLNMCSNCPQLSQVGTIDMANADSCDDSFQNCENLEKAPTLINTSAIENFNNMFSGCRALKYVGDFDTSGGKTFQRTFSGCYALQRVPEIDTSNATDIRYIFQDCYSLVTIPTMDMGSLTEEPTSAFANCRSLENIKLLNVAKSVSLAQSSLLSRETVVNNIINNLVDLTGQESQTLTLSTAVKQKLTDADIAIATQKNWVIA